MKYTAIAYDPEIGAPRVSGAGDTPEEATISCLKRLCKYLQESVRWVGAGEFKLKIKKI